MKKFCNYSELITLVFFTQITATSFALEYPDFKSTLIQSEPSLRNVEECGVEKYTTKTSELCGVASYNKNAAPPCNPIYNKGTDFNTCSDKALYDQYTKDVYDTSPAKDPFGYSRAVFKLKNYVQKWTLTPCRNKAFGIEGYEKCEHPAFGIATYKSCSKPEFGIESYKTCEIVKTRQEIEVYLASLEQMLLVMPWSFAKSLAEHFFRTNQKLASQCLIEKYRNDPFSEPIILDLIDQYILTYGESPEINVALCDDNLAIPSTNEEIENLKYWFEFHLLETELLLNSFVVSNNENYKTRLLNAQEILIRMDKK